MGHIGDGSHLEKGMECEENLQEILQKQWSVNSYEKVLLKVINWFDSQGVARVT